MSCRKAKPRSWTPGGQQIDPSRGKRHRGGHPERHRTECDETREGRGEDEAAVAGDAFRLGQSDSAVTGGSEVIERPEKKDTVEVVVLEWQRPRVSDATADARLGRARRAEEPDL